MERKQPTPEVARPVALVCSILALAVLAACTTIDASMGHDGYEASSPTSSRSDVLQQMARDSLGA
jgi:hypothetical protein